MYHNPSTILANYDEIYDSWDPIIRQEIVDLHNLPYQDESGAELRIYDRQGRKIPRRHINGVPDENTRCGLLMNLMDIDRLYNNPYHEDGSAKNVSIRVFPQAFLRTYGHLQATGVLHSFGPAIQEINADVRSLQENDPHFLSIDDSDEPLCAVSSQAYNEMTHRVATRAGDHDCQKGSITGAAAGSYANTDATKRKAKTLYDDCESKLPHIKFSKKIKTTIPCPKDLRMENVYSFDMYSLPLPQRSGR